MICAVPHHQWPQAEHSETPGADKCTWIVVAHNMMAAAPSSGGASRDTFRAKADTLQGHPISLSPVPVWSEGYQAGKSTEM